MTSLDITFAGVPLRNPVVVASAPPTETLVNIERCADAGAAAVITKTFADFDVDKFVLGARRATFDRHGMWALSTFRRETLSMPEGLRLIEQSAARVDIPVIASVGAMTMEPEAWTRSCRNAENAGATMIQLDLFYSPQPRSAPANVQAMLDLFDAVTAEVGVPVVPKLNIDLPAHHMVEVLRNSPILAVSAIDSLRVPVPLNPRGRGHALIANAPNAPEASLFGAWQKPVTLQYTRTLVEGVPIEVCAGGGLMNGYDAVEAMLLGATAVQFATAIIRHGFKRIPLILEQIEAYLRDHDLTSPTQLRGKALDAFATTEDAISFNLVRAAVDHDLCTMCGHCTTLVFCPDIQIMSGRIKIQEGCDGCGLCIGVCPTQPKALRLVGVDTDAGVASP